MRIKSQSDFWSGLLFLAIGVVVVVLAQDYRMGTGARMGPGYFPTWLGGLMAFLGLTLVVPAFFVDGEKISRVPLRPLVMIVLGIAAFGVTLEYLGFAAAVVALVLVSGLADSDLRPLQSLVLAIVLAIFSVVVFVVLLGIPLNIWPDF